MSEARTSAQLKQAIGLIDVAMLGAGAALGVSIFSVLSPAVRIAGSGILLAVVIAAVPMMLFATVYGFMASVLPKSGASYEWPRRFIHPFVGFLVAWLRILGSVGALVTLALVFVQYLSSLISLPPRPAMFCVLLVIFVMNVRGIQLAARAQTLAMTLLLTAFAIFVLFGAPAVRLSRIGNPLAPGLYAILHATPLLISLFLGIETATEIGEEVRDARTTIPRALALAFLLTVTVYLSVAFTTLGLLGPQRLAASNAPILEAAREVFGPFATPITLAVAAVALLKSINSLFVVFSRYLFAMARAGVLPVVMAKVHPRWGTPYIAATVAWGCTLAGLLLPQDLVFLLMAVTIPTVLKYLSTCLSALRLAQVHPDLAASARLRLHPLLLRTLSTCGIACAVAMFAIGFGTDWQPYALVGGWACVGILYWALRKRLQSDIRAEPA